MKPEVSIVIPSLGHLNNIAKLLDSIAMQTIDLMSIEVILIVNGSLNINLNLQISELLKKYQFNLNVVFLEKKGVNLARNYGLRTALSNIVIFFDDDCYIQDKKLIQKHFEFHKNQSEIFAFGGGYLLPAENKFFDYIYNYIQMKWLYSGNLGPIKNGVQFTRILLGGNFSIKKEFTFKNNLTFDEAIVYGGSEYEFFRQAYIAQMSMVLGAPDVIHRTNEGLGSVTRKLYKQGQGKAHIDTKYGPVTEMQVTHYKESFSISQKIIMLYLNYVFWAGYYKSRKNLLEFFAHVFKDFISYLNITRYKLLGKITKQLSSKKQDGDRF